MPVAGGGNGVATPVGFVQTGVGSPEGVVAGRPGYLYIDNSVGLLYQKQTGNGTTGWARFQTGSGLAAYANAADRDDAIPSPAVDQVIAQVDDGYIKRWDGTQWLKEGLTRSAGPVVSAHAKGAVADGIANDRQALLDMDAAVSVAGRGELDPGTYYVNGSMTFNGHVRPARNAILKPELGTNIAINGPFDPGWWKVFDFSLGGTVSFGDAISDILAEWLGFVNDLGVTDNTPIHNKIVTMLPASKRVLFLPGDYYFRGLTALFPQVKGLVYRGSGTALDPDGVGMTRFIWDGEFGARMFNLDRTRRIIFQNIMFKTSGVSPRSGPAGSMTSGSAVLSTLDGTTPFGGLLPGTRIVVFGVGTVNGDPLIAKVVSENAATVTLDTPAAKDGVLLEWITGSLNGLPAKSAIDSDGESGDGHIGVNGNMDAGTSRCYLVNDTESSADNNLHVQNRHFFPDMVGRNFTVPRAGASGNDAAMATGSNVITTTIGLFSPSDVGNVIHVNSLTATITAYTSPTQVTGDTVNTGAPIAGASYTVDLVAAVTKYLSDTAVLLSKSCLTSVVLANITIAGLGGSSSGSNNAVFNCKFRSDTRYHNGMLEFWRISARATTNHELYEGYDIDMQGNGTRPSSHISVTTGAPGATAVVLSQGRNQTFTGWELVVAGGNLDGTTFKTKLLQHGADDNHWTTKDPIPAQVTNAGALVGYGAGVGIRIGQSPNALKHKFARVDPAGLDMAWLNGGSFDTIDTNANNCNRIYRYLGASRACSHTRDVGENNGKLIQAESGAPIKFYALDIEFAVIEPGAAYIDTKTGTGVELSDVHISDKPPDISQATIFGDMTRSRTLVLRNVVTANPITLAQAGLSEVGGGTRVYASNTPWGSFQWGVAPSSNLSDYDVAGGTEGGALTGTALIDNANSDVIGVRGIVTTPPTGGGDLGSHYGGGVLGWVNIPFFSPRRFTTAYWSRLTWHVGNQPEGRSGYLPHYYADTPDVAVATLTQGTTAFHAKKQRSTNNPNAYVMFTEDEGDPSQHAGPFYFGTQIRVKARAAVVASGGTDTFDASTLLIRRITANGNITVANPTNAPVDGDVLTLDVLNNTAGAITVTLGSKFAGVFTAGAAGKRRSQRYVYDGALVKYVPDGGQSTDF